MTGYISYPWIGCLVLTLLVASCQPYEDVHEAVDDPEEASYAIGFLNGAAWEANGPFGINMPMHLRKGKVSISVYGIQRFDNDLYWDVLSISDVSWLASLTYANLNKDSNPDMFVMYNLIEYDVSVARYELDVTNENHLKLASIWGSADYKGKLEVRLVKTWCLENIPPTPDTLHLVIDDFHATRLK